MPGLIVTVAFALCSQLRPADGDPPPLAALRAERAAIEARSSSTPPATASDQIRFRVLPAYTSEPGLSSVPPATNAQQAIWAESARALFDLARRAARSKPPDYALADECLRSVLVREPGHAEARRLLGYIRIDDGWATPDAAELLRQGKILHPRFGWVPADWVAHLERGELPGLEIKGGQPAAWLRADQADALRSDFRAHPWVITTPHFVIRTNVPFAEVSSFGQRLEVFHDLFFALLADAIDPVRLPLARRLADPRLEAGRTSRRHEVWYFAGQREYAKFLEPLVGPDVQRELGRYLGPVVVQDRRVPGRSYFYRDPGGRLASTATLCHEVSHQLLFESAGRANLERNRGNFWVWEGMGCYFETLMTQTDGSLLVGGLDGRRIDEALTRILDCEEFVPIRTLTALGRDSFIKDDVASRNYAESMALAVFLIHFDDGRYRTRFLEYLRAACKGRLDTTQNTLAAHLSVASSILDAEFIAYLRAERTKKGGPSNR
jgi:hypothetical protein